MQNEDHSWIRTFTGRKFWPLAPRVEDVIIADIAHHLSMVCRFSGAVRTFYSVAEHSVRVSLICPTLQALLHDAPEAYIADLSRPVKHDPRFEEYRLAESRLWSAIAARIGVPEIMSPDVHRADNILLLTEKRDLLNGTAAREKWAMLVGPDAEALPEKIYPWSPAVAEERFLDRFYELVEGA